MSALGNLIPLMILFAFVGFAAYIGYHMYIFANDLADRGVKKMEKKNVVFTKDGMKVGVKEVRSEDYADKTQSVLVKAWSYASFPAYKSRLGWNKETEPLRKSQVLQSLIAASIRGGLMRILSSSSSSSSSSSARPTPSQSASSTSAKLRTKS